MAQKWLVGYSTKNPQRAFKTKREACNWALENLIGTFIIWKADVGVWKEKNGSRLRAWVQDQAFVDAHSLPPM
jgi:hypothetical protein